MWILATYILIGITFFGFCDSSLDYDVTNFPTFPPTFPPIFVPPIPYCTWTSRLIQTTNTICISGYVVVEYCQSRGEERIRGCASSQDIATATTPTAPTASTPSPYSSLSCDNYLRPYYPQFFTHCPCTFTDYSEWTLSALLQISTSHCPSGYVVVEKRNRTVILGDCENEVEERIEECVPAQDIRLALLLGLGNRGQDYSSLQQPCSTCFNSTIGKRNLKIRNEVSIKDLQQDVHEEESQAQVSHAEQYFQSELILDGSPVEFDIQEHSHRYKRRQCDIEHVLYMLDMSGSVGIDNFESMTCELSNLVTWFCNPIRIAAMTFSHIFSREMCFNDYDNTCAGRSGAKAEMKSIPYQGGWTLTSCALDFAFNQMINADDCGADLNAGCLTIVVITDGLSNGCRNICLAVQEYKQSHTFDIFSIGIGNTNPAELMCIADNTPENVFHYPNFEAFQQGLADIDNLLSLPLVPFTCVNHPLDDNPLGDDVDCYRESDPCN